MVFNKNKKNQAERLLRSVLDCQDALVVVTRGDGREMLFANAPAQNMMEAADGGADFSRLLGCICDNAKKQGDDETQSAFDFECKDAAQGAWAVRGGTLEWVDGRPATVYFARNVTEERTMKDRLYKLAYIDHLTGVPNRQKLKEDYEKAKLDVDAGKKCGVLALFDLDNFKSINDTYGHNTGDVMLRRLTEHLNSQRAFKEHLYRLGGDEFVLLYANLLTSFESEQAMIDYYLSLLDHAFMNYTMPNIDMHCTISMGVAMFPKHGNEYSDVLRKADIALYKAKNDGRNQLTVFEDRYDSAKKFKDLYINIQPILTAHGSTYGYELIDRGNEDKIDEKSMNLMDLNRSMDALDLGEIENDTRYFIYYTGHLLDRSVRKNIPVDKFVIELSMAAQTSPEGLAKYRELKEQGYSLAVTNISAEDFSPDLMALATFCKFAPDFLDEDERGRIMKSHPGKKFIADEVNTIAAFEAARSAGYSLFQGYFFEQPVVVKKTKEIDPLKVNYYRLLQLTGTDDYVDFREISNIISSDVALSYKLLRLLNSAAVGLRNKISSIDMGVAYLGEDSLKQWIALLALRGIASDKPLELVRLSLIRAHFGEILAPMLSPRRNEKHVFLTGLFSLLNIALEKTKEELFQEIPVADEIRLSLLTGEGPYSDIRAFFTHYEYSNWEEVTGFARKNRLNDTAINDAYLNSVKWYNDLTNEKTDEG